MAWEVLQPAVTVPMWPWPTTATFIASLPSSATWVARC